MAQRNQCPGVSGTHNPSGTEVVAYPAALTFLGKMSACQKVSFVWLLFLVRVVVQQLSLVPARTTLFERVVLGPLPRWTEILPGEWAGLALAGRCSGSGCPGPRQRYPGPSAAAMPTWRGTRRRSSATPSSRGRAGSLAPGPGVESGDTRAAGPGQPDPEHLPARAIPGKISVQRGKGPKHKRARLQKVRSKKVPPHHT